MKPIRLTLGELERIDSEPSESASESPEPDWAVGQPAEDDQWEAQDMVGYGHPPLPPQ